MRLFGRPKGFLACANGLIDDGSPCYYLQVTLMAVRKLPVRCGVVWSYCAWGLDLSTWK